MKRKIEWLSGYFVSCFVRRVCMKSVSGLPVRGWKNANVAARFIDEVVVLGPSHIAVVCHGRSCIAVLDRVPSAVNLVDQVRLDLPGQVGVQSEQALKANFLFRSFSSLVVNVCLDQSVLSVILRDGVVHVWQWDQAKTRWIPNASTLKLLSGADVVIEAAESVNGSWICIESSLSSAALELSVTRRTSAGGVSVLAVIPGDCASVRLWSVKEPVGALWVWSEYGGLCCVNLSDPKPFCPPSFYSGFLEQHQSTRELVWLALPEAKVWLLRPFCLPELLCTLSMTLSNVTSVSFLYQMGAVLDESGARCTVFDLGSGSVLRSFPTAAGVTFARASLSAPFVVVWSRAAGLSSLHAEPINQLQAILPPERGAKVAQDWGLRRVAAWRILADCRDPVALANFTASPALSVALAGSKEDPALVEVVSKYLANESPKRAFATLSSLTPVVDPVLKSWLAASAPTLEQEACSEQEQWELKALEDPSAALSELLQQSNQLEPLWRFALTCRLLFRLRPSELVAFVTGSGSNENERRVGVCASCISCADVDVWSLEQAKVAAEMLELSGNRSAAARVLIAKGIPQTIDFRLAFAEAMKRGDDDALVKLWSERSDLDEEALLRMVHVYGQESTKELTIGLLKRLMQASSIN
jgi:hypothetical protein